MYDPLFNTVLVEIDDQDAKWGTGNDDSMLGVDFRFGRAVKFGPIINTKDYPEAIDIADEGAGWMKPGDDIMWNKGVEAGTIFEHEGKQYAFIYWWDIRGVKVETKDKDKSRHTERVDALTKGKPWEQAKSEKA